MAACFIDRSRGRARCRAREYRVGVCMAISIDDALIEQVSGSADPRVRERAFRELVRRNAEALTCFLSTYQPDASERDDVVQETFLRVYMARERYTPGKAKFRTWLFTIGRNIALDQRRKRQRRPAEALGEDPQGDSGSGPIKHAIQGQEAAGVREAIARLPVAEREVVALRFYEDMSHSEISGVVGSSPAAVKQRIWRAMHTLRALLQGGRA
jgi:RNA polymerase sigma-70 factor, ECF subfamily